MNMEIKRIVEIKEGRTWRESYASTDPAAVYQDLAGDLIAKKINCCSYIRSIKRTCLYNGFQKIVVSYDNGVRATYIVKN